MIIVTNTIRVEKGELEHVVKQFTGIDGSGEPTRHIAEVEGFLGFELWQKKLEDADHDELVVTSKWESEEAQRAWLKSDSFKKAHGRTKNSREQQRDRRGILGNQIAQYEILHVQDVAEAAREGK
ncbi:heme-degrading monooxygenase IsdG [Listeria floridensis FSL S10-1187]|uniref:Heme-degrading monooxygenase IsdG n=1 Tax=Listeria floridensis FSL S10-1187 TaxID=1265817 RepID=A0ABN0RC46_9LIST|nr:heme oxygenase IsdG [Listeria floridensis]EUJ26363.1 heme-degrading monooxygenase IsdG [Listeria floridensis FSL S10-1187]